MNNFSKIIIFIICILIFSTLPVFAQEFVDIQVYNRNENVLVEDLLYINDKYFICVDDLEKINLQYNITEENNGSFLINIYSSDAYGVENKLNISATAQNMISKEFDSETGEFITVNRTLYLYSSDATLKKKIIGDYKGAQTGSVSYGTTPLAKFIDNKYYISVDIIGEVFSYLYKIEYDTIYLWITDEDHAVINGEILLRNNDVAPAGGMDVIFKAYIEDDNSQKYFTNAVYTIPENKNSVEYFTEIYIPDKSNYYIYVVLEYENNYKVIRKWCKINRAGKWIFDADINENNLGILTKFPVDITADFSTNEVFLINNGSTNIDDAILYCAFSKDNKLVDVISKKIEWIGAYEGLQRVRINFPSDYQEYPEIKLLLWNSRLMPISKAKIYQQLQSN